MFGFNKTISLPGGQIYTLFQDMLNQPHLLIAGTTGSGKSVIVNGIILTALHSGPRDFQFILIDPKRVELSEYKKTPHCIRYASEPDSMVDALNLAMDITERRYKDMQRRGLKKCDGSHVYIIIDEYADLITTDKRRVQPLIQRICQIGRAARVHVIACTQCPLSSVIDTRIKVNFDSRVGLRTRSKQDSRNILDVPGLETLPKYGQGVYMTPAGMQLYNIPMYSDAEKVRILTFWTKKRRRVA